MGEGGGEGVIAIIREDEKYSGGDYRKVGFCLFFFSKNKYVFQ